MLGGLLVAALAVAPPTATLPAAPPATQSPSASATQPASPNAAQIWLIGDTKFAFRPVPIGFPLKAGTLTATNHKEASHEGENLDNAIDYYSSDQAVFGTVYIYRPGLAHAGLAAIAEDWVIRLNSPRVTGGETRIVGAGGKDGVALRASYAGYLDRLASAAAYIKTGRWLLTIRVSGPEARKADVEGAMDAFLAGITFGVHTPPRQAPALSIHDCPGRADERPAKLLRERADGSAAANAFLGTFDGAGIEATDRDTGELTFLPSRVPTELCRSQLKMLGRTFTLLRGMDGAATSIDGRTVRLALLSDSGGVLEVDHAANLGGYVVLHHDIGRTDILGVYDGIPSDKQLADIVAGVDQEGARIRSLVRFHADRQPEMVILSPVLPAPAAPSTQPSPPTSSR